MKINKQAFTRNIGRKVLIAKKNSPHIFFVGGVAGVIGSAVLACRATLKLEEKLDEIKSDLDAVKAINKERNGSNVDETAEAYKYTAYVSVKSAVVFTKLYGPSIALGAVSIGALTGSHMQLTRRNAALTATLAVVTRTYDEYRLRVKEAIGEEKESDIYRDATSKQVEVDGKKKTVKVPGPAGCSGYARFFDQSNVNWQNNPEFNEIFIQCQQNYANHILHARGHVFLNEVYDMLGFEHTTPGAVVGWVVNGAGDGYIDFGLYEDGNVVHDALDKSIILDFNVDGVVYDKI